MQDNWYEVAVSADHPHRIISVVDWASDSPIPSPPSVPALATYNVFAWGVNDPSEGDRTMNRENHDSLSSPVGWHALPYTKDPSLRGVRLSKNLPFYRNTTTTWGNNVSPLPVNLCFQYSPSWRNVLRSLLKRTGKVLTPTSTIIDLTEAKICCSNSRTTPR
jgi:hypothetical protein